MMKNRIILSIIVLTLTANLVFCQGKIKTGLTASFQESQYGILVPIWLGERFVLAPALNFSFAEKMGTDIGIGLAPRFYLKKETVSPYFGLKFGAMINLPYSELETDKNNKVDIVGGVAFGAEYFLAENFSLGVEAQGNLTKSDEGSNRYGNPGGLNFNLGTMLSATVYF
jgi:hypothetical protein